MYKITLHYQSNIKGIYTTEIETALNEDYKNLKFDRLLDKWFNILCPHINFERYMTELQCNNTIPKQHQLNYTELINRNKEWKKKLIQNQLDILNDLNKEKIESGNESQRVFEINVEEIENP